MVIGAMQLLQWTKLVLGALITSNYLYIETIEAADCLLEVFRRDVWLQCDAAAAERVRQARFAPKRDRTISLPTAISCLYIALRQFIFAHPLLNNVAV